MKILTPEYERVKGVTFNNEQAYVMTCMMCDRFDVVEWSCPTESNCAFRCSDGIVPVKDNALYVRDEEGEYSAV